MPYYDYICKANGRKVEVSHPMSEDVSTWGQVCELAGMELGDTPADAPVTREMPLAGLSMPKGNAKLKELGFTKLVKRDEGVYENVTRLDGEARYMKRGDESTLPDIKRRVRS